MKSFENKSILNYNSFQVEATTDFLTIFHDETEVESYFHNQQKTPIKKLVIGEGSNILFASNFKGHLYKIENRGIDIIDKRSHSVWVKVAAGENWDELVDWAVLNRFGGIENLSLIPGTVGAAPVQNIGAYGVEFSNVFNSLEAVDMETGEKRTFYLQELEFDYRHSIFKGKLRNRFLITSVVIKLNRYPVLNLEYGQLKEESNRISNKSYPDLADVRASVIKIRQDKLPDPREKGNAGSFFKNPIIGLAQFTALQKKYPEVVYYSLEKEQYKIAAAWLIEKAGLKGYQLKGAATHPNHSLILINNKQASGLEIQQLAKHIQTTVKEIFDVDLEAEVLILE